MKKLLLVGLFLFPTLAFAQVVPFSTNLSYGSTGSDVTALQEFLTAQQVYTGPISGNFYSLTLAAVKRFQTAESITPVSGFVGPITRGTINALITAPDSEENAATTTEPVDLSTTTVSVAPSYAPPQIIYVQVPVQTQQSQVVTPVPPEVQATPEIIPTSIELVTQYPREQQFVSQELPQETDVNICDTLTFWPVIFDQNGNQIPNPTATFINPDTQQATTYAWYQYTSTTTNSTKVLNYSSGNLNGSYTLNYGSGDDCSNN